MNLSISHLTCYRYDREVQFLPHLLYLRPRDNPLLQVASFAFRFTPSARVNWMRDDFDNLPASAHFEGTAQRLEIQSNCDVVTSDTAPFDFLLRGYAARFPFDYEALHRFNLTIYLTPPVQTTQEILREWIQARLPSPPRDTVACLAALNRIIFETIRYARRDEPGIQSALTTVQSGTGTCRDYAELLIAIARTLGIAARFVSGYLFDPAQTDDAGGDMHAWAEVFLPGAGWRGLDPTHGIFCDSSYVPVAHAVVAESVNPIQGTISSATPSRGTLTTVVRVRRTDEADEGKATAGR